MITETDRNKAVLLLCNNLISNKQYEELVMVGSILLGDKHPAVLKSYEIMIKNVTNENVIEMYGKIRIKLDELRKNY